MKKISILLTVILSMTFTIYAQFGGGNGTQSSPYVINTPAQLQKLAEPQYSTNPDLYFRLNYTSTVTQDFQTIEEFRGHFEGSNNTIALNNPFIKNNYGKIQYLGIILNHVGDGPASTWEGGFGAIACNHLDGAEISRCYVAGSMTNMGKGQIGGIAGTATSGSNMIYCKSYIYIESRGEDVGGIVGYSKRIINQCYAHGTVIGAKNVGGLVGRIESGVINLCRAYMMVYGDENAGGLFGYSSSPSSYVCTDSYAHGVVKGKKYIGGLGGYAENFAILSNMHTCYSAVVVDNRDAAAGTAGLLGGYAGNFSFAIDTVFVDIEINRLKSINEVFGSYDLTRYPYIRLKLLNTAPVMNSLARHWESTEGTPGYGIHVPPFQFEWYNPGPVELEEYMNELDPNLINRVVKWNCFGLSGYTTWTDVVLSGTYLNYETCELFNVPEDPACYEGSGTAADPYQISTPEQLDCMMDYLLENTGRGEHFRIMNDINMLDYLTTNYLSTGWRGNEVTAFDGYLHGGGHTISNIWVSQSAVNTVGGLLAGTGTNAVIDSLGIIFHSRGISALGKVGGLVGHNKGEIYSCFTLGGNIVPTCDTYGTGGLVGYNEGAIEDSYTTCNIIAPTSNYVGGLVGYNKEGIIMYTYAAGMVLGGVNTGGLVGTNYGGRVRFCYFDIQTTFQQTGIGNDDNNQNRYVYGNYTADMKNADEMDLLDFRYTWKLIAGYYPILQWQKAETAPFSLILPAEFVQEIDLGINTSVKIYPNPTTGILYIETAEEKPQITVYNSNGSEIIRTTEKTLDFTTYPNGMYILNVNGQMEKVIKK